MVGGNMHLIQQQKFHLPHLHFLIQNISLQVLGVVYNLQTQQVAKIYTNYFQMLLVVEIYTFLHL